MSNILRDVFSNEKPEIEGNIQFKDNEGSRKFLEALETVYKEGRTIHIDGATAVTINLKSDNGEFASPPIILKNFREIQVGPFVKKVPIKIPTESDADGKDVELEMFQSENNIEIDWGSQGITHLNLVVSKANGDIKILCQMNVSIAERIEDISESLHDTISILASLVGLPEKNNRENQPSNNDSFSQFVESLIITSLYIDQLVELQGVLKKTFPVSALSDEWAERKSVHELYRLLIEEQPVKKTDRNNALTSSAKIEKMDDSFNYQPGTPIILTFEGNVEYEICGEKFPISTANLVSNAIIKETLTDESGTIQVFYGDADSKPMFLSFMGFKTEEGADEETDHIMEHKEDYENALTIEECISQWVRQRTTEILKRAITD